MKFDHKTISAVQQCFNKQQQQQQNLNKLLKSNKFKSNK